MLSIRVDPLNGRSPKRLVVVKDNDREVHRDTFDVDSAFLREKFIGSLAHKIGADDGALAELDTKIVTAALAADGRTSDGHSLKSLERITSRGLADGNYHQTYIVEDVVPDGQPGIIAARYLSRIH